MQVIILANGTDAGWNNHLGVPKQLVRIDGERILDRTVRQVIDRVGKSPIIVTTRPILQVPNAEIFIPSEAAEYGNPHPPGLSTASLWDDDIALLLGDVRYSDAAMDTILQPWMSWTFFCRFGPRRPDGSPIGGEGWAVYCPHSQLDRYLAMLHYLDLQALPGQHFWQQYRAWNLRGLTEHGIFEHHIVIDDETEDFDFPSDLHGWLERHPEHTIA